MITLTVFLWARAKIFLVFEFEQDSEEVVDAALPRSVDRLVALGRNCLFRDRTHFGEVYQLHVDHFHVEDEEQ